MRNMGSILKRLKKAKKSKKVMTGMLALSLVASIGIPQVAANNEGLGYTDPTTNTNPGNSGTNVETYRVLADPTTGQPEIEATRKGVLTVDGKQFRDLNGNKSLDIYEDWRKS